MKRTTGMMAGLLVLAACGDKEGSPKQQVGNTPPAATGQTMPAVAPARTMGVQSFHSIDATCTVKPVAEVTMTLDDVFGGLSANRRITRSIKKGPNDVPQLTRANLQPYTWSTNLDFDTSTYGSGPVKVNIVLNTGEIGKSSEIRFLRPLTGGLPNGPEPVGKDSSIAVLVPAPANDFSCRTDIDVDVIGQTETISFVMNRVIGSRSINIGLLVPTFKKDKEQQMWMPIFLDPNMRNEG